MQTRSFDLPETTANSPLKAYCDASIERGTGLAAAAWTITDHNGRILETVDSELGKGYGSVEAEAQAMKILCRWLHGYNQVQHLTVYTDCRPAIYHAEKEVWDNYESLSYEWIPREKNELADKLAEYAMLRGSQSSNPQQTKFGVCD
jgi:ribonuclease HI